MSRTNSYVYGLLAMVTLGPTPIKAQTFQVLYAFQGQDIDGAAPLGGVVLVADTLFGTTSLGGSSLSGTIFSIRGDGTQYEVVHNFAGKPTDGAGPVASLTVVGDVVFGTTIAGGRYDHGTVFSYQTTSKTYKLLYSFAGGLDGAQPRGKLTYFQGSLFGTTMFGGRLGTAQPGGCADGAGCGTIFQIDLMSGLETTLYRFQGGSLDGNYPLGGLTPVDSAFYGTASDGGGTGCYGGTGCGTIFRLNMQPLSYQQIHAFGGGSLDGAKPVGELTYAGGLLYGNTEEGGGKGCIPYGCGTVFSVTPSTTSVSTPDTIIYRSFGKETANGFFPFGNLKANKVQPANNRPPGLLFGLTLGGGVPEGTNPQPFGTVYQVNLHTHVETVLHAFDGFTEGARPNGSLAESGNRLYGVAYDGGRYDSGTVFMLSR